jgi:hypothetical protein
MPRSTLAIPSKPHPASQTGAQKSVGQDHVISACKSSSLELVKVTEIPDPLPELGAELSWTTSSGWGPPGFAGLKFRISEPGGVLGAEGSEKIPRVPTPLSVSLSFADDHAWAGGNWEPAGCFRAYM